MEKRKLQDSQNPKEQCFIANLGSASNSMTMSDGDGTEIDVSVVLPCLNEEATVGGCINDVKDVFKDLGIRGEIIVADSSCDNSPVIAKGLGAKLVYPRGRGYGNAYLAGIREARGKIIVMADADGTYDLKEISKFIKILNNGNVDIVVGTRLKGKILPGAMPRLHRYIGNPLLTLIANILFKTRLSDMHCGMRAITKKAWKKIKATSTGMEFASEMLIKAAKKRLKIVETPITYHPRRGAKSKLNPIKDGYRHLKLLIKSRFTK
ncbi:MAG: glycosyltransferase family 2 protein [Candidatus Freyarchaeota archaeon]|nr:glycosyltransferase family 2 protein [Candidatus Jordarchaeia archaeon]MBS7281520.1 glycosyltransferase family 2 protein [Candidatus Jordarchaeia archaeon]